MTAPRWMMPGQAIHLYYGKNPTLASSLLDKASTFSTGTNPGANPNQDGFSCTPVLVYNLLSDFMTDVGNSSIISDFEWVMYDIEQTLSPGEQTDPIQYLQRFGQFAHANGFRSIAAPARDLGNVATVNPKIMSETNDQWYLRVNIPGVAGQYHDIVLVQSQADETNLTNYDALVGGALTAVHSTSPLCNPYALVFQEVSTSVSGVSPMIMETAVASEAADGVYVNLQNDPTQLNTADTFFQSF